MKQTLIIHLTDKLLHMPDFRLKFLTLPPDTKNVILDFSKLRYIAAPEMGILKALYNLCKLADKRLIICGIPGHLKSELNSVEFLKDFEIFETLDLASANIQHGHT
jgi:anti-anti-sigma regulatory factor